MAQAHIKTKSVAVLYDDNGKVIGIAKCCNLTENQLNALKNELAEHNEKQLKEKNDLLNEIKELKKCCNDLQQEIKLLKGEE